MSTLSRRVGALAAGLAAALTITACGGSPAPAPPAAGPAPVPASDVTEYVGAVDGSEDLLIAFATQPGGAVEAYVCNGQGIWSTFTGTVAGDRIDLTSADGSNPSIIAATLADAGIDGTLTLDGQPRTFTTTKATGIGGLYDFTLAEDGTLSGVSERGNTFTGREDDGVFGGTFAIAGGEMRTLTTERVRRYDESFAGYRVVITDDAVARGNPKSGTRKSEGGTSFSCCYYVDF